MSVEVLADGYGLVEAPRADGDGGVYFTDVLGGGVYRWRADGVETIVPKRRGVGGLAVHADGGLVVAGRDIIHVAPDRDQRLLWSPPDGIAGINDICALTDGTLVAGALRFRPFAGEATVPGEFWSITAPAEASVLAGEIDWANGCGVSNDGATVYLCDYSRGRVHAVDRAAGKARVLVDLPDGEADGLAVDAEGGVWVAQPQARRLVRVTPEGDFDRVLDVGVAVTSLAFDGDSLYLTSLRVGSTSGALLRLDAPVPGPRHQFATL